MKILFFSHYFPPEVNAPASRTYENCKRWVEAGHDVTVVTCAPNCPNGVVYDGYKNRLFRREVIDGIDVRRVWTYIAANEGTLRRIANYLSYMVSASFCSFFIKRPDIIIATSPQFFAVGPGSSRALCGAFHLYSKFAISGRIPSLPWDPFVTWASFACWSGWKGPCIHLPGISSRWAKGTAGVY